jgi:hypothetical protein
MVDSSFWDAATDFNARDVVELAVTFGTKPTELDGTKIRTLYERMERSYNAKVEWHTKPEDERVYDREFGSVKPNHMLESMEMAWATAHDPTDDGLGILMWLRDPNRSAFETQRFTRPELARWFAAIGVKSRYPFETGQAAATIGMEESLSAKERGYLLKMVIGMAILGYKYVPSNKKSLVTKEIADDVVALGMSITDDTVRKYLREAVEAVLPKNPHQS